MQDLVVLLVGEGNIAEGHNPHSATERLGFRPFDDIRSLIEERKSSFGTGQVGLQTCSFLANSLERSV
jgi:hypothetical protein